MKSNLSLAIFFSIFISSSMLKADEGSVARVIILKGQARAKLASGEVVEVKEDLSFSEGTTIQTAEKSFVKLMFIDKSQMNLGPSSQMVINAFPKNDAGIITLLKGQMRSKVTKDYMEMNNQNKSKLYIKTKTAALGIRGTDFQVNYNPENSNSSLITFEGKVAMSNIDKKDRNNNFDQSKLESLVSSERAVMVERGHISTVNLNVSDKVMKPTLLGATQLYALKKNETGTVESNESVKQQFRNPIPPGAQGSIFTGDMSAKPTEVLSKSEANGFFNKKTGEYKLPAGAIIDLKTVNIIPPPPNAAFDQNTKTYIVPEVYGRVNKDNGDYIPPEGLKLGTNGKFILVDAAAFEKTQTVNKEDKQEDKKDEKKDEKKDDKKVDKKNEVPKIYDSQPDMAAFTDKHSENKATDPATITDAQRAAAADKSSMNEVSRQTSSDLGKTVTSRNLKFILKAQ